MSRISEIRAEVPPSGPGCADCEAQDPPGWWLHLRRCARCGHVGCCDSSPSQHATAHYRVTGHRVVQSYEPGEDWFYDYPTGDWLDGPRARAPDIASRPPVSPGAGGARTTGLDVAPR